MLKDLEGTGVAQIKELGHLKGGKRTRFPSLGSPFTRWPGSLQSATSSLLLCTLSKALDLIRVLLMEC